MALRRVFFALHCFYYIVDVIIQGLALTDRTYQFEFGLLNPIASQNKHSWYFIPDFKVRLKIEVFKTKSVFHIIYINPYIRCTNVFSVFLDVITFLTYFYTSFSLLRELNRCRVFSQNEVKPLVSPLYIRWIYTGMFKCVHLQVRDQ